MKVITVNNFSTFEDLYSKKHAECQPLDGTKNIIFIFVANDDPETKKSWCPDCVLAKPVIDKMREKFQANDEVALAYVMVGLRDEWKNPENPYRTHELKISCVPTIVSKSNGLRLNGSECSDEARVLELFSNSI